jgi:hypothetical protein
MGNKKTFSFELSWMRQDGFCEMVLHEWNSVHSGSSPVEKWQHRLYILDSFYVVGLRILVVFIGKRKRGFLFL